MADRMLMVCWGSPVRGREELGLEVFNEAVGLAGRMQQDGRIESFDIGLFSPNSEMNGYLQMRGSAEQMAALALDEEFTRNTVDASLIVENLRHLHGVCNEGIAPQMAIYAEARAKVPQTA
jgi:hypothetical protein